MITPRSLRAAALGVLVLALAGCSNKSEQDVDASSVAKSVFAAIFNRGDDTGPDPNAVAQAAAAALANTSGEVILIAIPDRDAFTTMQEIERNGAYVTFGSSDRRSITMKYGIITATRGLGNDLMSAEVDAVSAMIRGRDTDAARRINRYLDGENLTVELDPWCQIKPDGPGAVGLGEVHANTTRMLESCLTDGRAFQNDYQVDGAGRIVQSRQWISPFVGYMVIQSLR